VSIKQYTVFLGLLGLLFLVLQNAPRRKIVQAIVASALTFAAILLPFALWDWPAFYQSTFEFLMAVAPRTDALTWVAALLRNGVSVPGSLMSALYLLATVVASALLV